MPATTRPGPRTPVWAELNTHAARLAAVPVQELFERDPGRFERLSRERAGLLIDFSRQRLDEIALAKLFQLADVIGLRARIDAMWQGAHINTTSQVTSSEAAPGAAASGTLTVVNDVPTLSGWMLMTLAAALAVTAAIRLRA